MNEHVIAPPAQSFVPVAGMDAIFPVRRIYCVGRNYAAHAREMGGDERDPPFFFQKPGDAIVHSGANVPYPPLTRDFHHEIELVLAIGKDGSNISRERAVEHVYGLATGIDFTRRDLQKQAREAGRPWETGKAFDHSAAIAPILPLGGRALPTAGSIRLTVDGALRQNGDLSELIWSCAEVVAILSTHNKLVAGDLIYTGTPAGVGALLPGQRVEGHIADLPALIVTITEHSHGNGRAQGTAP